MREQARRRRARQAGEEAGVMSLFGEEEVAMLAARCPREHFDE
jgi:hypothetical protein